MKKIAIIVLAALAILGAGIFVLQKTTSNDSTVKEPATTGKGTESTSSEDMEPQYTIGFSCADMSDPYYIALEASIRMSAKENGIRLLTRDARSDLKRQMRQIGKFADRGVDVAMIAPVAREGIEEQLQELKAAGIPIIMVGSRIIDMSLVSCYVGADRLTAGSLCGSNLKQRTPEGGNVLIVECGSSLAAAESITGFETMIAGSGYTVSDRRDCADSYAQTRNYVLKAFDKDRSIMAVMCATDHMALGAVAAVKEFNAARPGEAVRPLIYSVGGYPEIKKLLTEEDSLMTATVTTSPLAAGQDAVLNAVALMTGEEAEEEVLERPFLVDRHNIELYGTDGWQ